MGNEEMASQASHTTAPVHEEVQGCLEVVWKDGRQLDSPVSITALSGRKLPLLSQGH